MRRKLFVTQMSKAVSVAYLQKNVAWIVELGLAYRQPSQLEGGMSSSMFLVACQLVTNDGE